MKELNKTKTELIIFRLPWKQLPYESDIRPNNCKLKLHAKYIGIHVKYIGIFIDKNLSCIKKLTLAICSKLIRANGIFSKLRHFGPLKTFYPS